MVQRLAGQLITPETWPGCGSQPHPAGAGTRASGNALRIDPAPKRLPWPLGQGAEQLLQHLLALRPEDRCSAAEALQSRYFQDLVLRKRHSFKQQPKTPMKPPCLAGTTSGLPPTRAASVIISKRQTVSGPQAPPAVGPKAQPSAPSDSMPQPRQSRSVAAEQQRMQSVLPNSGLHSGGANAAAAASRLAHSRPPIKKTAATSQQQALSGPPNSGRHLPGAKAVAAATVPLGAESTRLVLEQGNTSKLEALKAQPRSGQHCQCKGNCGQGTSAHPMEKLEKGCSKAKKWYGPCKFLARDGAGEVFCEDCVCSTPGCKAVRLKGPLCCLHARLHTDPAASVALRAVRILQVPLANLLPIDLESFLHTARPDDHPAVLIIMALLWHPKAVELFARKAGEEAQRNQRAATDVGTGLGWQLRGEQLAAAVLDTVREVGRELEAPSASVRRFFGPHRTAQLLGLLRQGDDESEALPASLHLQPKQDHQPCRELLKLPAVPKPKSMEEFASSMQLMDSALQGLGAWSRMKGTYQRPCVLRKIAMLYQRHCLPDVDWRTLPRQTWLACSPDSGGHLLSLLACSKMTDVQQWAPRLPPICPVCGPAYWHLP